MKPAAWRPLGIRLQLLALFGLLLLTGASVILVDAWSQHRSRQTLQKLTDESLAGVRLIKSVTDSYRQEVVDTAFRVRNHLMGWEQGDHTVAKARERIDAQWEELRPLQITPAQRNLFREIGLARIEADRAAAKLRGILQAEDMAALGRFADTEMFPAIDPVTTRLDFLADLALQEAHRLAREDIRRSWMTVAFAVGLSLFTFAVVVGVGRRILRNIYRGVESLTHLARAMQRRELRADPDYQPTGELGEVLSSFLDMRSDVMGYEREITEQLHQNELVRAELESRNSVLDAIFAAAQVSIVTVDSEGRITGANPFAERLLQLSESDLLGRNCLRMHDPEEVAQVAAELSSRHGVPVDAGLAVLRWLAEHGAEPREWTYVRADGSRVRVLLAVSPLRSREGAPLGYIGVATDLTRIKALEHQLRASEARAHEASEAKSAFLAAMSHEIRTPMIGVTGMLEVLAHSDLNADQRHAIAIIQQSAASLLQIIGDILDFSKIEAGRLELAPVTLDLGALVRSTVANFVGSASSKGLTLDCRIDEALAPALVADPLRIRQVVSNFLSNAIKFTETGGIQTSVSCEEEDERQQTVRISVADTGIGIDPGRIDRLFEPFTQAEGETTRRYGGTGLGLAICQRLALLMDGRLEIDSTPGEGTRLHLVLTLPRGRAEDIEPVASVEAREAVQPRALPDAKQAEREGSLILLVDDHPTNRLVIARQLALAGYASEAAGDGAEGLDRWRSGRYALVLSDVHMPQMDGYQLARAIRQEEDRRGLARTPVVALTAAALRGEAERCLAAGMDDYLAKPVSIPRLAATLQKWLPHTRPAPPSGPPAAPTPLPQANRPPPLDEAAVGDISGGNAIEAGGILHDYLDATERDLGAVSGALQAGDAPRLAREAHRLKGAARLIGAHELAAAAAALEAAAADQRWPEAQPLAADLETAFDRLRLYITEHYPRS